MNPNLITQNKKALLTRTPFLNERLSGKSNANLKGSQVGPGEYDLKGEI